MQISGRNQLRARVTRINLGDVMAEVIMELDGGQALVAAITRSSVESLGLAVGHPVYAVIKATEIMVGKD